MSRVSGDVFDGCPSRISETRESGKLLNIGPAGWMRLELWQSPRSSWIGELEMVKQASRCSGLPESPRPTRYRFVNGGQATLGGGGTGAQVGNEI
ncbi:hypothetical protein ACLKA6_017221 [Drosophila palustris]